MHTERIVADPDRVPERRPGVLGKHEGNYFPPATPVQWRRPTERQVVVLRAVYDFVAQRGHAPTLRELCDLIGIASTNGASCHLHALTRRGLIARSRSHLARGFSLTVEGLAALGVDVPAPAPLAGVVDPPRGPDGAEWVKGTVYFLEAVGADRLKIGFTKGPLDERLRQLQTGAPFPLQMVASFWGSRRDESRLHERFYGARCTRGRPGAEWFHVTDEIRDTVARVAAALPAAARVAAMVRV